MPLVTAKRFNLDEYHQLAEIGFFKEGERIELINGEMVHMAAKGVAHENCITELNEALVLYTQGLAKVRCQSPILLPPNSEPEPDFVVVKKRLDCYLGGHPKAADILLLIEVSDSFITYDQTIR